MKRRPVRQQVTLELARACYEYSPEDGVLTRIGKPSPMAYTWVIGEAVGCLDKEGYLVTQFVGNRLYVHRLIWFIQTGEWPSGVIDHRDGVRANNRWSNLRDASLSMNAQNLRNVRTNSKSGWLGAMETRSGRYRATIKIDGKNRTVGYFSTPEEAHAAYLTAKRVHHAGCTI